MEFKFKGGDRVRLNPNRLYPDHASYGTGTVRRCVPGVSSAWYVVHWDAAPPGLEIGQYLEVELLAVQEAPGPEAVP